MFKSDLSLNLLKMCDGMRLLSQLNYIELRLQVNADRPSHAIPTNTIRGLESRPRAKRRASLLFKKTQNGQGSAAGGADET